MNLGSIQTQVQTLQQIELSGMNSKSLATNSFINVLSQLNGSAKEENPEQVESVEELKALLNIVQGNHDIPLDTKRNQEPTLSKIAELMNMPREEIEHEITSMVHKIAQDLGISKEEYADLPEEEIIPFLVEIMAKLTQDQLQKYSANELSTPIQATKIRLALVENQDQTLEMSMRASNMKQDLQQLVGKIESIIKNSFSKESILQLAFRSTLPTDGNGIEMSNKGIVTQEGKSSGHQLDVLTLPSRIMQQELHLTKAESLSYEKFVKEFSSVLSRAQFGKLPNMNKLLIKLYPEELGSLRIELLHKNGLMTARILTSTIAAKELIDSQLHGLKQAFQQQNLQVEKMEVQQMLSDELRQDKGNQKQQNHQQHQKQKQNSDSQEFSDQNSFESFKELLLNIEI
ncbi:flagellar hook-length control protein FliK [Bacillus spongiae]|uniref:Flagellar hook-length control protein FliK n=1 Tax=Bacillus spongiae TaxID=2683610 RepID=A0ABU8HAE1_9BACI